METPHNVSTANEIAANRNVQPAIAEKNTAADQSVQYAYTAMVNKVAHDLNSPLTAVALMLRHCDELEETKRVALKNAFAAIKDIANNILNRYDADEIKSIKDEERQLVLCSDFLHKLISETRYQYQDLSIKFVVEIEIGAQFAFILAQPSQFRRALSNFISNAVDASKHIPRACVTIQLAANQESVKVTIQDNGKGMTRSMVSKIYERTSFTAGKENGHGLGMMQIWDMVDYNQATLDITSHAGVGTASTLTFSRAQKAAWVIDEINIYNDDIIVILDDDPAIHDAWDMRISQFGKFAENLVVRHEKQGGAALEYINSLNPEDRKKVNFLCDFELIGQGMNGLQVIEASHIQRAVLVTNYYHLPAIQNAAIKSGVRILPKQMASTTPFWCTHRSGFYKINVDQFMREKNSLRVEQVREEYCV